MINKLTSYHTNITPEGLLFFSFCRSCPVECGAYSSGVSRKRKGFQKLYALLALLNSRLNRRDLIWRILQGESLTSTAKRNERAVSI
jgi:hypothetical protein